MGEEGVVVGAGVGRVEEREEAKSFLGIVVVVRIVRVEVSVVRRMRREWREVSM